MKFMQLCRPDPKRTARRTGWALYAGVLIALLGVCELSRAGNLDSGSQSYQVKDSGLLGRSGKPHDLYWLDSDRIIVIASKSGEMRVEKGNQFSRDDLFVWNVITDEVRREDTLSWGSELCVAPRYLSYLFERDGVRYIRFGKFQLTHEVEFDEQAIADGILALSRVSCKEYNPKWLVKRYGRWAIPLMEPGEYLDRTQGHFVEPMRYFPADGAESIPLPNIPNRNVIRTPRYSEYLNKYVFNELLTHFAESSRQRAWLLDRQGRVQEITLPSGPWMAGSIDALPAKSGWVFTSTAIAIGRRVDAAGIYLLRNQQVIRLISGYPHAFAVSPDGCKVAVALDRDSERMSRATIQMINLCSNGE